MTGFEPDSSGLGSTNCHTMTSTSLSFIFCLTFGALIIFIVKIGLPWPLFLYFLSVISFIKIPDDWNSTADRWCWNRPLYQLCHNHYALQMIFLCHLKTFSICRARGSTRISFSRVTLRPDRLKIILSSRKPGGRIHKTLRIRKFGICNYSQILTAKVNVK